MLSRHGVSVVIPPPRFDLPQPEQVKTDRNKTLPNKFMSFTNSKLSKKPSILQKFFKGKEEEESLSITSSSSIIPPSIPTSEASDSDKKCPEISSKLNGKSRIIGGLRRAQSSFMSSMSLKRKDDWNPPASPSLTNLGKTQNSSLDIELADQKEFTTWNLSKKTPLTDSGTVVDRGEIPLSR